MDERFINQFVWGFVVGSEQVSGRFTAGRIIRVSVLIQFCFRACRVLFSIDSRHFRFFFQRHRQVTRSRANEHVVLRVDCFDALSVRFFQDVRDSMNLSIVGWRLCVLLMCFAAFQLTMQSMFSSRTCAFVGLCSWPFRELRGVFFHAQGRAIKVHVLSARGRVSPVLTNGRVVVRDNARAACVRYSY